MSNASEPKIPKKIPEAPGSWIGGKPSGHLKINKDFLTIKLSKATQKFPLTQFPSVKDAEIHGKTFLYNLCKSSGKLINEYRYIQSTSETYLEVKVGKIIIKLDVQYKDLIENHEWLYSASEKSVYRKSGKSKICLEQELFSSSDPKQKFTKLDGNILNYRLKNLKPSKTPN